MKGGLPSARETLGPRELAPRRARMRGDQERGCPKGAPGTRAQPAARPEPRNDAEHFDSNESAPTVQVHLVLQRRIQELQAERQNRWQRILKLIQG